MYNSITKAVNKSVAAIAMSALALGSSGVAFVSVAHAAVPNWNTTGSYVINMDYLGTGYLHDMTLAQDGLGGLTGNGGSPAGANTYTWVITSGSVSGDAITFTADYTATPDAVTPQTTLTVIGTIAPDGTLSGTWTDNYQASDRGGVFTTVSGAAVAIPVEPPATVTVTINKYIDGVQATATSAGSADFPMSSTWNAENIGAGSGSYTLGAASDPAYQAMTAEMTSGADYTTSETLGEVVGATCTETTPFSLVGYTSGDTLEAAQSASSTLVAPAFTGMTTDKYVIVWNHDCSNTGGTIGGEVVGGPHGVLAVTSIDAVDTTATANGTFADGWKYVFHITAPDNETNLSMKFADWINTTATGTIAVAGNMRISSAQADNGGATVLLTAANTYSSPALHMTADLDPLTAGNQVEVTVEVAVPAGTTNGSYTTSYGVQTLP